MAVVDALDRFDPQSAAAAGVALDHVLWVRGEDAGSAQLALDASWEPSRPGTRRDSPMRRAVSRALKALALVVEHGRKARESTELPRWSRCPRCQRVGDTLREFGLRTLRGRRVAQSWCRTCRGVHGPHRLPAQASWLERETAS